ncbi:MAG: SpoIIE family protein phosphatase [Solirubrobacteraceae bacterium]
MAIGGPVASLRQFLQDAGEVGRDLLVVDWEATELGPPDGWPASLQQMVRVLLGSRFAMWMAWGRELTFFCNDAYRRDTLGGKYPWALGRPASEVWAEIWPEIGPRIERVLETGEATWDESLPLFLERSGYEEETYHTFSYSPVSDESGAVAGMLCVVTEETERVIADLRLAALRDLGTVAAEPGDEPGFLRGCCHALGDRQSVLPFGLVYLFDAAGESAQLACEVGIAAGEPAAPELIDCADPNAAWPAAAILDPSGATLLQGLGRRFDELPLAHGRQAPDAALLLALRDPGQQSGPRPLGFLVAALNPHRPLDDGHRAFLQLAAGMLATGVASARAYAQARERARELTALDAAKTAFFTNVSHELRTPLTLLLAPAQDALGDDREPLGEAQRGRLAMIARNGTRLLGLVNELLDFSRLEAGEADTMFVPVELAGYTRELTAMFEEPIRDAGLELSVACEPLSQPAFVDREMWDKIVLNLLSNALKFTDSGSITVAMVEHDGDVVLTVADTGTGIAPADQRRLFERFHRVPSAHARSHEGSGIGLALVAELASLHGGSVSVCSAVGEGSAFTVQIPLGHEHLPAELVAPADRNSPRADPEPFLAQARRWRNEAQSRPRDNEPDRLAAAGAGAASADERRNDAAPAAGERQATVLVVDDNQDMREYVADVLRTHHRVRTAADGVQALEIVRGGGADLVLTDVMMPRLDGFGLLAALRADPATAQLPVVMLSARAGEEGTIEGLEAGADDYLVKPFSSRELQARVTASLELARLRSEAARAHEARHRELQEIFEQMPAGVVLAEAPSGRLLLANRQAAAILGGPLDGPPLPVAELPLARALSGETIVGEDVSHEHSGGRRLTLRASAAPVRDVTGTVLSAVVVFEDITERTHAQALLSAQRDALASIASGVPVPNLLAQLTSLLESLFASAASASVALADEGGGLPVPGAGDPWSAPIRTSAGHAIGAVAVRPQRPHAPSDHERRAIELIASTAAIGIERARAETVLQARFADLQRSLRPPELPDIPGLSVAASFRPGSRTVEVGGDFYDLFATDDGRWALMLGDVCGHGTPAAATTAIARHTARALALDGTSPSGIMNAVNRALLHSEPDRFVTMIFGYLSPAPDGSHRVVLCRAAHPAPLLLRHDGVVLPVAGHGPALGISETISVPEVTLELRPGDALVMHTDGVIERNPLLDELGLEPLLRPLARRGAQEILAGVTVAAIAPVAPHDDVALLVLAAD